MFRAFSRILVVATCLLFVAALFPMTYSELSAAGQKTRRAAPFRPTFPARQPIPAGLDTNPQPNINQGMGGFGMMGMGGGGMMGMGGGGMMGMGGGGMMGMGGGMMGMMGMGGGGMMGMRGGMMGMAGGMMGMMGMGGGGMMGMGGGMMGMGGGMMGMGGMGGGMMGMGGMQRRNQFCCHDSRNILSALSLSALLILRIFGGFGGLCGLRLWPYSAASFPGLRRTRPRSMASVETLGVRLAFALARGACRSS